MSPAALKINKKSTKKQGTEGGEHLLFEPKQISLCSMFPSLT